MTGESGFDWRVPNTCQYDVSSSNEPCDCGEPAPYQIWWETKDGDGMFVCRKHFTLMRKTKRREQDDPGLLLGDT